MKSTFFYILCISIIFSCNDNNLQKVKAKIQYLDAINVGSVNYKDSVKGVVEVLNIGTADLIIKRVSPSCECTVPTFDSMPVKSGEKTNIYFSLKLKDTGWFEKNIVFEANTDSIFHAVIIEGHGVE